MSRSQATIAGAVSPAELREVAMSLEAHRESLILGLLVLLACGLVVVPGRRRWDRLRALLIGGAIGGVACPLGISLLMGAESAMRQPAGLWLRFRMAFGFYAESATLGSAPSGALLGALIGLTWAFWRGREGVGEPADPGRPRGIGTRARGGMALALGLGSVMLAYWMLGLMALTAGYAASGQLAAVSGQTWRGLVFLFTAPAGLLLMLGWLGLAALLAAAGLWLVRREPKGRRVVSLAAAAARLCLGGLAGAGLDALAVAGMLAYRWLA